MHEVGQIIFLVSRKAQSVLAAQICEQNVKKTLDGEETTYRVRIGMTSETSDDLALYDLDRIDADIYSSPEAATESLYKNAKSAIDTLIEDAVSDAQKYFNYQSLPFKKATKPRSSRRSSAKPSSKRKQESEAEAPTDKTKEIQEKLEDDTTYVTMPDGTRAKLRTPITDLTD